MHRRIIQNRTWIEKKIDTQSFQISEVGEAERGNILRVFQRALSDGNAIKKGKAKDKLDENTS